MEEPAAEIHDHYRAQVRAYLDITETERGLIVLVTSGVVIPVTRSAPSAAVPLS
jgi:exodeoxyribonuclease-5